MKGYKVVSVKGDLHVSVARYVEVLRPVHKLSKQEGAILAELLYVYLDSRVKISDDDICWKLVFHSSTKKEICGRMDIEGYTMQTLLSRLRKRGIIKDNKVIPSLIPDISAGFIGVVYKFDF